MKRDSISINIATQMEHADLPSCLIKNAPLLQLNPGYRHFRLVKREIYPSEKDSKHYPLVLSESLSLLHQFFILIKRLAFPTIAKGWIALNPQLN